MKITDAQLADEVIDIITRFDKGELNTQDVEALALHRPNATITLARAYKHNQATIKTQSLRLEKFIAICNQIIADCEALGVPHLSMVQLINIQQALKEAGEK